ncbi:MAG: helix-turn-helix domain-containing protein [Lachnospiraceae bacterium]|nr:helix-turn-helix domain-containing protein [Lachnospiraceae bacterium]
MELNVTPGAVSQLPGPDANIFISKVNYFPPHIHETSELLLMLSGKMQVGINHDTWTANEGDLILINARTLHSYQPDPSGDECTHVVCQIDIDALLGQTSMESPIFFLNSVALPDKEKYKHLRYLIARLVYSQSNDDQNTASRGLLYEILSELILNFSESAKAENSHMESKYEDRRLSLINYIAKNYSQNLTLNSIAAEFNLSVPYLSAFFKEHIGVTFTEYYNILRLNHAVNDMLSLDDSIDTIAHNNGFTDTRTFVRLFRQKYGMLPSVYRKSAKDNSSFPQVVSRRGNFFHPSVPKSAYLPKLSLYQQEYLPGTPVVPEQKQAAKWITCPTLVMTEPASHSTKEFQKVCFMEHYQDLLQTSIQRLLADLQQEIGFNYISFNIASYLYDFSDRQENFNGSSDFYYIDQILDFLLSIRLYPMLTIKLDYQEISDEKRSNELLFDTSIHRNMLARPLESFLRHIIARYGIAVVSQWRFRLWYTRIQDTSVINNFSELFELYHQVYTVVKNVSPSLKICSHAVSFGFPGEFGKSQEFAAFCKDNNCFPDFFYFTYSSRQSQIKDGRVYTNAAPESWTEEIYKQIQGFQQQWQIEDIPSYLFEYDLLTSRTNPINDTCYKSCYLAHNIVKNLERSNMTGFWQLTDTSGGQAGSSLFHGETSMYTYNGIAKPYFHAFAFINRLGSEILARENGCIATRDPEDHRIIVLFYNYDFYDDVVNNSNYRQRHSAFQEMKLIRYSLKIDQVDGDYYTMKQYCVSASHGSSYDVWVKMGSPKFLSESSMNFIRNVQTDLQVESDRINNGIINLEAELEPLEIRLIELEIF